MLHLKSLWLTLEEIRGRVARVYRESLENYIQVSKHDKTKDICGLK